ncbi:MAG: VOC family protein [Patescibacteria group bacterium]
MKPNPVVHFEFAATDMNKMKKFYAEAFGWTYNQLGEDMGNYCVAMTSESDKNGPKLKGMINGGFYNRPKDDKSLTPSVVIAVDDVDESLKRIREAGGKLMGEPMDIPGVGKFASFIDPEGYRHSILKPIMP